jgi:N-acetylglucosamine-6-phosphate deacetylase
MLGSGERGQWSVFAGCDISGGVDIHIHGSAGGGVGAAYSLSLRRVLATAREVGLVIVPTGTGKPRAFVLAATPAVRDWVEQGFRAEPPPWQVADLASPGAPIP